MIRCWSPARPPAPACATITSTGLPGISRGRYQFSTSATPSVSRVHSAFPARYRLNVVCISQRSSRRRGAGGPAPLASPTVSLLRPDLGEHPDARARPRRRRERVARVREPAPDLLVVLEELQRPVLQRDHRD